MKKPFIFILALFLSGAVHAGGFDLNGLDLSGIKAAAADMPAPAVSAPKAVRSKIKKEPVREWTAMFFLNGKSDDIGARKGILDYLGTIGDLDDVNIVVEWGFKEVKRYKVANETLVDVTPAGISNDMGDYRSVTEFINWSKTNFPAKHYLFMLTGHGLGWMDPAKEEGGKAISFDTQAGSYISTPDLAKMFRDAGGVDVFVTDACLMQMAEVVYELKDSVPVVVASEQVVIFFPALPPDYASVLKDMDSGGLSAEAVGREFVGIFDDYQKVIEQAQTYSAVRTSRLPDLASKLRVFSQSVKAANDTAAVNKALDGVLRFFSTKHDDSAKDYSSYGDLYNFIELLSASTSDANVKAAGQEALAALRGVIIKSFGRGKDGNGDDFANAHGLTIELTRKVPGFSPHIATQYPDIPFARDSGWADFVKWTDSVRAAAKNKM